MPVQTNGGHPHSAVTPHLIRLVVLLAANVVARLALQVESHEPLWDSVSALLLDASALYWVYCLGLDLRKHFSAADANDEDVAFSLSSPTPTITMAALTSSAAVVLALTAYVGARLQHARIGGPWLTVVALLIGVVDARAVADGIEHSVRTRRVESQSRSSSPRNR
jgi:hypothetical protein